MAIIWPHSQQAPNAPPATALPPPPNPRRLLHHRRRLGYSVCRLQTFRSLILLECFASFKNNNFVKAD